VVSRREVFWDLCYSWSLSTIIVNCSNDAVSVELFADDAKLYTVISNDSSAANLQSSLDYILSWSDHWQLKLSPSKCTVMHLTSPKANIANPLCNVPYSLCDLILLSVSTVTDLGVCYDKNFSFRPHINYIVAKASLRAKLILKCFITRNSKLLSKAFSVFVRPILEFSSVVWSPYFKTDINKIESVQKRFTKACLPKLNYNERLSMLGLQTLETRRIMSDLTTCYKILNNNIDIDLHSFFS